MKEQVLLVYYTTAIQTAAVKQQLQVPNKM